MLNPLDDYPVHQTPEPLAHAIAGDRNFYDRYFFHGYSSDGAVFFAAALGLYPNRSVMDAAFSVVRDGVQTSVHASRRAPLDRTETRVGPVAIEVVEPMRRLAVRVGPNDSGVTADLTFTARTVALEEPRFTMRSGTRVVMDYTRLTQFGSWEGDVVVDGERTAVGGGDVLGARDRSWGIRSVGEREVAPPGPMPQFYWLWAPVNFDDRCTHLDVQEDASGRQWHAFGAVVPLLDGPSAPVVDLGPTTAAVATEVTREVVWRPGTRRAASARLAMGAEGGEVTTLELEPLFDFQMLGVGYFHPEWSHGVWKGEEAVGAESWRLADLDPIAPQHLHVQSLCRARLGDGRAGMGVLEQLVIGPHAPSGFTDLFDGAPV